ncbi:Nicastrin [Vitis vinifera]|uniref:Nicastrin n=1 Tax=Vitis vinifera TaxID=29760 RepID=A0A438H9D6_VITVI|nr:Nicastrin [Vitis vinifera]
MRRDSDGVGEGKRDHLVSWDVVCKPKAKGCLGFGKIALRNVALLGKWLWRYPKEGSALWHKVILSIYGSHSNGWDANTIVRWSHRCPQKAIAIVFQEFSKFTLFVVGDGERIQFWEDFWWGDQPLGLFTVKSFFLALSQCSGSPPVFPTKFVWKSQVPFKVKSFVWLVAHKKVSSVTNETLNALQQAKDSLKSESIMISTANSSNPGIPPSSLMSFLRKNSSTSGIVLEDFDATFANQFYHSHLDDLSNVNSSAIVAAASLVARTLYILASDDKDLSTSALSAINVNASLVEALLGCLLNCDPGLSCDLVKKYIAPRTNCPSNYVGVLLGEPSATLYPGYVSDVSRFIWNFLADRTSIPRENATSACPKDCSNEGEVCIGEELDGKGVCVISTTRYTSKDIINN